MSPESVTLLTLALFVVLLVLGLPLAFVTGATAIIVGLILWEPDTLMLTISRIFGLMTNYVLVAVPMFIFMGHMLQQSGVMKDVFRAGDHWLGGLRGGLASATVAACVIFAAITGIIGSAIVTMGLIALPAMLQRAYDKKIATGSIMAGGSLGTLIPPSVPFIFYGMTAGQSIGKLFLAGVGPGLLLAALYVAYITIRCTANPRLAPPPPPETRALSLRQKLAELRSLILPGALIIIVLGSIFGGIATPTEASGVGALGAVIIAAVQRRLTLANLRETAYETLRTSAMLMWLFFGATALVGIYTLAGGATYLTELIKGLGIGSWGVLLVMLVVWFVLGMFIDWLGILLLTVPIFLPIIIGFGFNPIWFGVLYVMNMQLSYLSPPFAPAVFYLRGVAPREITTGDLIRATFPFMGLQWLGLLIVLIFPAIALWLPNLILK